MVEAAGVEPASLKPSAQMYYKLSRYYILCLACYRQTAYTKFARSMFILDRLVSPQFFARCRRPSPLTSIQSRTERNLSRCEDGHLLGHSAAIPFCGDRLLSTFNVTKLGENLVSFGYGRSHVHVNIIVGI